jgi:hypothetical protein
LHVRTVNMHCFYTSTFLISCFILSVIDGKTEQRVCIKFCVKLSKCTIKPLKMLSEAFGEHCLCRIAVFEFKAD